MRHPRPSHRTLLIAAWLAAVGAAGPSAAQRGRDVFRSAVDLVYLNVTVTGGKGRYVTDLGRDDFVVREDGARQELELFAAGAVPLDVAVLLDTSSSMTPRMPLVREAALGFLRSLRPGDRATVVGFSDVVRMPAGSGLTGNIGELEAVIQTARPRGSTALYTAVYVALKMLGRRVIETGEVRRPAMVVLSDGADTTSLVPFDDVLELARRSGVCVYTILLADDPTTSGPVSDRSSIRAHYELSTLARETGGRSFRLSHAGELNGAYDAIVGELSQQYSLAYRSMNPNRDGGFRRIDVRVVTRAGAHTRTRSGYFAPRDSVAVLGGPQ